MADHEFFGTVSASEAATASDHLTRKDAVDALHAIAIARANHTGTQTISTISDAQSYVDGRIALVIDSAPSALDTLNELAAALGDDANFSTTVTNSLDGLDTRIDALEAASGSSAYKTTFGDAVASSFTITHNLNTQDCIAQVIRMSDKQIVYPVVKFPTANTASVDFGSVVPASNAYRIIVNPL